jgi:hypothetical protein
VVIIDKKSVTSNAPTLLAATGGLVTAIVGLLTFMSVPAPSIAEFDASPNIISVGETSVLKWSVTGDGATVNIGPGIGIVGLSGTREVAPNINTSYFLTAKNKDKEKIASVQIIVREKNEAYQVTNDVVSGIAAKSNVPVPRDVKAEPDQKQNEIYETIPPAAETRNPDESAIASDSDSQHNAVAQPAQMVASTGNSSESSKIEETPAFATNISDGGVTEQKAPKVITAEDWGRLNKDSISENDFTSSAPIYAKLRDTRHTPAYIPDYQDPAVSDPGFADSDYLSTEIQSLGSSGMDTQL